MSYELSFTIINYNPARKKQNFLFQRPVFVQEHPQGQKRPGRSPLLERTARNLEASGENNFMLRYRIKFLRAMLNRRTGAARPEGGRPRVRCLWSGGGILLPLCQQNSLSILGIAGIQGHSKGVKFEQPALTSDRLPAPQGSPKFSKACLVLAKLPFRHWARKCHAVARTILLWKNSLPPKVSAGTEPDFNLKSEV
jgi:hypothetical protein